VIPRLDALIFPIWLFSCLGMSAKIKSPAVTLQLKLGTAVTVEVTVRRRGDIQTYFYN
jgi:hypothetical protein